MSHFSTIRRLLFSLFVHITPDCVEIELVKSIFVAKFIDLLFQRGNNGRRKEKEAALQRMRMCWRWSFGIKFNAANIKPTVSSDVYSEECRNGWARISNYFSVQGCFFVEIILLCFFFLNIFKLFWTCLRSFALSNEWMKERRFF